MRILHCCFAGGYSENCAYQENLFTELHRRHGHDVMVAASNEAILDGKPTYVEPGEFVTESGVVVRRLSPAGYVPGFLRYKIRAFPAFAALIEEFSPDIIYFHSVAGHELLTAAKYKRSHPKTVLIADSHATTLNSAVGFFSKEFLHKRYYRSIYKRVRGDLDALYYVGILERDYLREVLGVRPEDMDFLSLGGIMTEGPEAKERGRKLREKYGISDDCAVFCFSGKIRAVKSPETALKAMELCGDERVRLFIVGAADDYYLELINKASAKDKRIIYTGWQTADVLVDYLLASDAYLLPARTTATLQTALCCGSPAVVKEQYTYTEQFGDNSGVIFFETAEQLAGIMSGFADGIIDREALSRQAATYARKNLDYDNQARLIESFAR